MKHCKKGEILWHQGDPSRVVLRVVSGQLEIVGTSEEGEELVHRRVGAGEYLGEMSALDGAPHSATVVAVEECQLEVIQLEDFQRRLRQDPELSVKLLKQQNLRIRLLSERRLESAYQPIRTRLANHLLRQFGDNSMLSRTHEQLAKELGTTRESVTKSLKQLASTGALTLHRGKLELKERTTLEELAQ